ncbi:MAG: ABC transporter permease [Clostridiales bacterium]|nr:ABC transporter permease [Clostridiales bacterium]
MNKAIIKQAISSNWKLWTILTGVFLAFIVLILFAIISNFDDISSSASTEVEIGIENIIAGAFLTPVGLGGILMTVLAVVIGNKLVAREVDSGSMSFVLNTETTRKRVLLSKAFVYFVMLILFAVLGGVVSIIMAATANSANITVDMGKLSTLLFGFILYSFAISSISFCASCWFNKVSFSLMIGAGIPLLFLIMGMIAPALASQPDLQNIIKSLTLTTLFDASEIIRQGANAWQFVALAIIGLVLYTVGIIRFLKKDLPL